MEIEIKNNAVIYCRVSSKEQEETGYSLDAQEKLLGDYAIKLRFEVTKVYRISESASGRQIRKTFEEMLLFIKKNKVPIILCEKIDRLTRNLKDAATISDWLEENIRHQIHFVKENFIVSKNTKAHENLVWDMKVAIARFYTNNLSEEVKKGQIEKLAQGWLPQKPPLGYKTIGGKGHKIHVLDTNTAPLIRKLYELYATGNYSTIKLSDMMFELGLRSRANKKVVKSRIHNLLSNPFYCGKISWNGTVLPGSHEPVVSETLFEEVQKKLHTKLCIASTRKYFPTFRGKIKCTECGCSISWYTKKGHWYGSCSHYHPCSQRGCNREEEIERQLFPYFDKIAPANTRVLAWLKDALEETRKEKTQFYENQLLQLVNRLEMLQNRLEALYEDKIDRKIPLAFYERKNKEYTAEKEQVSRQIEQLKQGNSNDYETVIKLHELALKAKDLYSHKETTTEEKRLLLSYLFSQITLKDKTVKPQYTEGFEILAKWMPTLNATFELAQLRMDKGETDAFASARPVLLRW